MIVTADTNVFLYSVDERDAIRFQAAQQIVDVIAERGDPIGLQVCGEFFNVAMRKFRLAPWDTAQAARNMLVAFPLFSSSATTMARALAEAAAGRFSFWDANLLSAAEAAGCTHFLSEDMHDGARFGRMEIVAAFGPDGLSDRARSVLSL